MPRRMTNALVLLVVLIAGTTTAGAAGASAGAKLWMARYDGPAHDNDDVESVVYAAGGSEVIETGASIGLHGETDIATVAYAVTSGRRLWVSRYSHDRIAGNRPSQILASPSGDVVYVVGRDGSDFLTLAYDSSTGARLWTARYDGPTHGSDAASAAALTPDGATLVVTGGTPGLTGGLFDSTDWLTIAYDAKTGARRWIKRYAGTFAGADEAYSIAASPDGKSVVVTGSSEAGPGDADVLTVEYSVAHGVQRWLSTYRTASVDDVGRAATFAPDGSEVYVAGVGHTLKPDDLVIEYDASTGAQGWAKTFDAAGYENNLYSAAVTPDGTRVIVDGFSYTSGGPSSESVTIGYDALDGTQVWMHHFQPDGLTTVIGGALAITSDSTLAVVGGGTVLSRTQFAVGYDARTGKVQWSRVPDGLNSATASIAVSPDNHSFVTGGSGQSPVNGHFDYITLAYAIP